MVQVTPAQRMAASTSTDGILAALADPEATKQKLADLLAAKKEADTARIAAAKGIADADERAKTISASNAALAARVKAANDREAAIAKREHDHAAAVAEFESGLAVRKQAIEDVAAARVAEAERVKSAFDEECLNQRREAAAKISLALRMVHSREESVVEREAEQAEKQKELDTLPDKKAELAAIQAQLDADRAELEEMKKDILDRHAKLKAILGTE